MLETEQNINTEAEDSVSETVKRSTRTRKIDGGTIGIGLLVALAGGGLFYMHTRTAAGMATIGDADANTANMQGLVTGGQVGLASLSKNLDQTRQTIDSIDHRNATLASAHPLERDPFAFHTAEPQQVAGPVDTSQAAREAARAKALTAARALQLQSIMYGTSRRSCLVDGKLYFEGQQLGDFTVNKIATDAIIVQSGEFKFEIRLHK